MTKKIQKDSARDRITDNERQSKRQKDKYSSNLEGRKT